MVYWSCTKRLKISVTLKKGMVLEVCRELAKYHQNVCQKYEKNVKKINFMFGVKRTVVNDPKELGVPVRLLSFLPDFRLEF